jgi:hypothetical protein
MEPGIQLGRTYRDKISDFIGVATGYVQYITGCNQVLLGPKVKEDGSLPNSQWFDEQRLEPVQNVPDVTLDNGHTPGFGEEAPIR